MRPKFLAGVDLKKLREYVAEDGGDGHTIWSPEKFTEMGFDLADLVVEKYESGEGKYQITHEGKEVSPTGVWNLQFMRQLAAHMKVDYPTHFFGRGSQARAIKEAVLPVIDKLIVSEKGT